MILIIFLSIVSLFIVIVPILVFICTEVEEPPPNIDYKYEKENRKQPDVPKPSESIENFADNADEISVNAEYHVLQKNAKKPSEDQDGSVENIGFRIQQDSLKDSSTGYSDTGYSSYSGYS